MTNNPNQPTENPGQGQGQGQGGPPEHSQAGGKPRAANELPETEEPEDGDEQVTPQQ